MPIDSPFTRRSVLRTALAAAVALPLSGTALSGGPAQAAGAPEARLQVMSYNVRYASNRPPHTWPERRPAMKEMLLRAQPHIIGTQEGLYYQLQDIESDLGANYDWVGTGVGGGSRDEFMAIFYDNRRLFPLEYEHFWLSDTPYTIASNTWGANSPRMASWVRFLDLITNTQLYVLNTHFDHVSQNARERSAALMVERIALMKTATPLIVTGDFNATAHDSTVYTTMLGAGLVDTWDVAQERGPAYGTFGGYKPPVVGGGRIDWVLTRPSATVHSASMNTFSLGGQYPSDHWAVQATLTL